MIKKSSPFVPAVMSHGVSRQLSSRHFGSLSKFQVVKNETKVGQTCCFRLFFFCIIIFIISRVVASSGWILRWSLALRTLQLVPMATAVVGRT